jgi:hypothetical protein
MTRFAHSLIAVLVLTFLVSCSQGNFPQTAIPEASSTSTQVPTLTVTSVPPTATFTPVPAGPCDNPIIPLVTGNQWQYLVTSGEKTFPYQLLAGNREDGNNIVINVQLFDEIHQWTFSDAVVCLDGTIDSFLPYYLVMLLTDNLNGQINLYTDNGNYAPSYQVLSSSGWTQTWQVKYLVEDYIGIQSPDREITFNMSPRSPITAISKVENKHESITVAAGTYPDALVMKVDYSLDGFVASQGYHSASTLIIKTTQWVMPFIGVLRAVLDSAQAEVSFGQSAVIDINSKLELTGFVPGH